VDDATGNVPQAQFQAEREDSAGYLRLTRALVEKCGIPLAIYRDQHGTFQRNDSHWSLEEQLAGRQFPTQVGRAWEQMGIETIVARSLQAKGRIERLWRTLQDRLVSELRATSASTLEQAHAVLARFLGEYNQQFTKPADQGGCAYRKLDSLGRRIRAPQRCDLSADPAAGRAGSGATSTSPKSKDSPFWRKSDKS
jgi:hypothetical protein